MLLLCACSALPTCDAAGRCEASSAHAAIEITHSCNQLRQQLQFFCGCYLLASVLPPLAHASARGPSGSRAPGTVPRACKSPSVKPARAVFGFYDGLNATGPGESDGD